MKRQTSLNRIFSGLVLPGAEAYALITPPKIYSSFLAQEIFYGFHGGGISKQLCRPLFEKIFQSIFPSKTTRKKCANKMQFFPSFKITFRVC
jgi:hypothetical protein